MAAESQTADADIGLVIVSVPTCHMCGLPKIGPLCEHCDKPCQRWRTCPACRAGHRFDGIGPKTAPWQPPR